MLAVLGILYGWLPATDLVADHGVELRSAIGERNDLGDDHVRSTTLTVAPAFGITDRVELALPFDVISSSRTGSARDTTLARFGAELGYRFVERDVALQPTLRFALERDVTIRDLVRSRLTLAATYEHGAVHLAATATIVTELNLGGIRIEAHPGAGASVRVHGNVRAGAEIYGELGVHDASATSWFAAGPNVTWSTRRFWLAAALGIGISDVGTAPRLQWGVTL